MSFYKLDLGPVEQNSEHFEFFRGHLDLIALLELDLVKLLSYKLPFISNVFDAEDIFKNTQF